MIFFIIRTYILLFSLMENIAINMNVWLDRKSEIYELKAQNNVLLQRVHQLETKINRSKQKNIAVNKTDEKKLNVMVAKSLTLLAKVQTLEVIGQLPIQQHQLDRMVHQRYGYLIEKFTNRLYYKRQQRLLAKQRLFHLDFRICQ